MSEATIRAYFDITQFDCEPNVIGETLGVQPSTTWLAGDPIGPAGPRRSRDGWRLQSRSRDNGSVEAHVAELLQRLPPSLDGLADVTETWVARLSVVIEFDLGESTPSFFLERKDIARLEELGAEFDVDMYLPDPNGPGDEAGAAESQIGGS